MSMKPTVLWVVGEPGVGKTTLTRLFLEPNSRLLAKPKWTIGGSIVAAGHYTGGAFDGADTVPYNGAKAALECWSELLRPTVFLTLFDGDRFSNANTRAFFDTYGKSHRQRCILLSAPAEVALARRVARGTTQNPTWVLGRTTKSRNFFETFAPEDRREFSGIEDQRNLYPSVLHWLGEGVNG